MKKILLDPTLQRKLDDEGFVILDNFIDIQSAKDLRSLLDSAFRNELTFFSEGDKVSAIEKNRAHDDAMMFALQLKNLELQKNLQSKIAGLAETCLNKFLSVDYQCPVALGSKKKYAGDNGGLFEAHNHFSAMDTSQVKYPQLEMFIPLDDINANTGPVGYVNGSHKLFENYIMPITAGQIRDTNPWLMDEIQDYFTYAFPKVGQAVLFHQYTIHQGLPVAKDHERYSLVCKFIPKSAQPLFYFTKYSDAGNKITAIEGRPIYDLPYYSDSKSPGIPINPVGDVVHRIEPFVARNISVEEFRRVCRLSEQNDFLNATKNKLKLAV